MLLFSTENPPHKNHYWTPLICQTLAWVLVLGRQYDSEIAFLLKSKMHCRKLFSTCVSALKQLYEKECQSPSITIEVIPNTVQNLYIKLILKIWIFHILFTYSWLFQKHRYLYLLIQMWNNFHLISAFIFLIFVQKHLQLSITHSTIMIFSLFWEAWFSHFFPVHF